MSRTSETIYPSGVARCGVIQGDPPRATRQPPKPQAPDRRKYAYDIGNKSHIMRVSCVRYSERLADQLTPRQHVTPSRMNLFAVYVRYQTSALRCTQVPKFVGGRNRRTSARSVYLEHNPYITAGAKIE